MEGSFGLVRAPDEPGQDESTIVVRMRSEMVRGPGLSFERYMKI